MQYNILDGQNQSTYILEFIDIFNKTFLTRLKKIGQNSGAKDF